MKNPRLFIFAATLKIKAIIISGARNKIGRMNLFLPILFLLCLSFYLGKNKGRNKYCAAIKRLLFYSPLAPIFFLHFRLRQKWSSKMADVNINWRRYKYAAFIFGQAQKQRQTAEEFWNIGAHYFSASIFLFWRLFARWKIILAGAHSLLHFWPTEKEKENYGAAKIMKAANPWTEKRLLEK